MNQPLTFTPQMLHRPTPSGVDVVTTLRHFAIITYIVDANHLATFLPDRFIPDTITTGEALISVVPFEDVDFRAACFPSPRFAFGQTNYRAYIIDKITGERAVWFFGTCLGSWTVCVPRHLWKLPWHSGRFCFDCDYDHQAKRYRRYVVQTQSPWADGAVELVDTGQPVTSLAGFNDLESAMVVLTHPLRGYYQRRDQTLGTYDIWHDPLQMNTGQIKHARFDLLDRLQLVPYENQNTPHSVLMRHETEFTIYLPPSKFDPDA